MIRNVVNDYKQFIQNKNIFCESNKKYPDLMFEFMAFIRYTLHLPWRALEGMAQTFFEQYNLPIPDYTTIYRRCQNISIKNLLDSEYRPAHNNAKSYIGAIDSTGLKLRGNGEWLLKKHGENNRRRWLKFHIISDVETHEIIVYSLTSDKVGDSREFEHLLKDSLKKVDLKKLYGDGGYDSKECFNVGAENGVEVIIKPRKNARARSRGSAERGKTVYQIKLIGLKEWKKVVGYSQRVGVERMYTIFKGIFGDKVQARRWDRIKDEIRVKVEVLNYFMGMLN